MIPARRILALVVLCAIVTACGPSARQKTLRGTLVGLNAARDGFIAWDDAHQTAIVDRATYREDAEAALAVYRAKREPVLATFTVAYRALSIAALDKDVSLAEVLGAAEDLARAIAALKGSPP